MVRLHYKLPNSWAQQPRHRVAAVEEFILGDTTAGEFNCTKHMAGTMQFNRNWPHQRIEIGRLRTQFQRFGADFAERWPRWTGARLIKVHLHSKSFGGL